MSLKSVLKKIPDFKGANFLIRVPLAIVFILQGLSKLPLNISDAESYGLPMTVWFFVAWGELLSGIGLLILRTDIPYETCIALLEKQI